MPPKPLTLYDHPLTWYRSHPHSHLFYADAGLWTLSCAEHTFEWEVGILSVLVDGAVVSMASGKAASLEEGKIQAWVRAAELAKELLNALGLRTEEEANGGHS